MDRLRQIFKRHPQIILPAQIGTREVGWAESQLYNAKMPKYNPDDLIGRKGHKIYRKMMIDEQVKAVVRFKRDAITARDWMFEMPNTKSADNEEKDQARIELYEAMIRQTYGSFVDGMNYILMAMYQGFSMTEKLFDTFDHEGKPWMGIRELIPKPFETFKFEVDKYGSIVRTIQKIDNDEQNIDLNRFVYYVQNPEFDRHYGQSDLREAYRSWYSKDIIIRFYNQFLERFGGGFAVGKPSSGAALTPGTPEYKQMVAALDSIRTQTSLLVPSNMEIDIEKPSSTDQYEKAIALHDLQIAKALLVPNLLGITPQASSSGGGFAQANTQLEAFLWTLDADATRLQEALNEQIFNPLSKLNFPDGQGPLFRFKSVSESKKIELVKTWQELVVGGSVEASDADESHLRQLLEFPDKTEPLDLEIKIGEANKTPDAQIGARGPVKEANTGRVNNSAAFTRAEKRVSINVIERQANKIEGDGVTVLNQRIGDMVADLTVLIADQKIGTSAAPIAAIQTVDFHPKQKTKVRKTLESILNQAWVLGTSHAKKELGLARKERFSINFGRIDEEAAEFLRLNGFRAFGTMSDDMRAIVHNILVNGVKFSWTSNQITDKIYDEFVSNGFIGIDIAAEATSRTVDDIAEAIGTSVGLYRVETMVRTNVFDAINEARFSTFTDPALDGFVEAFEYSAILDSRTTAICRHLDGRVYPVNSPVWNKWRPLNHFNCRSILVPVTVIDDDVIGRDNAEGSRFSRPPTIQPQAGFGG